MNQNKTKDRVKRSYPNSNELIDLALAKFFFGCNISFNIVESNLFREFIKLLNPDYKVPPRKRLSNHLLNKVHKEVTSKTVKEHETVGVLLIDGWKNSATNTKLVVCTIHTVMDNSMYLNSWDLTGIKETGNALTKIVDEATEIAKNKFNIRIYAVVSDNASAMILMGNSINLCVWHVICASHSGNLLAKSLVEKKFAESVNQLLKEFKQLSPEKEIIKGGGQKIILACETRWCSYRDAFRCCLYNLSIMRQIIKDQRITIKPENSELLFKEDFETSLQDYILIFDPVCELINKCQRSRCEVYNFLKKELNVENLCDHVGIQAYLHDTDIFKILSTKNITSPQTYWFIYLFGKIMTKPAIERLNF